MAKQEFNPIATAEKISKSYSEYIATTRHFDNQEYQKQLEEILATKNYLSKGPFLEAAAPYRPAATPRQLIEEGIFCKSMLLIGGGDKKYFNPDRPLYVHQEKAIRKAADGRNYVVVTGTGSGKTECFLLPIINDILAEFEKDHFSAGVRAMILYPMNALANDQLKRLRELLKGTDITFGRYTGETKEKENVAQTQWNEENPGQEKLPNELISREEIRRNPPNILLTNYSMLEYLLLRPEDAPLFNDVFGAKWRHLAIDEAHVYSGALGTEIAYLLRRLKARIACEVGVEPKLQCYATSATIGSKDDLPHVAEFAQNIFGEEFHSNQNDIDVITGVKDSPVDAIKPAWGQLPLSAWIDLRKMLLDVPDKELSPKLNDFFEQNAPQSPRNLFTEINNPLLALGSVLLGEKTSSKLIRMMDDHILDLSKGDPLGQIGITTDLDKEAEGEILASIVEVLSTALRSEDVPILTSRYHSFLRAPEGLYINLYTNKLIDHKALYQEIDGYKIPLYEMAVCRHCGQSYILGTEENEEVFWLNPENKEFSSANEGLVPHVYYRLVSDYDEQADLESCIWLCPICGSLSDTKDGGKHRFEHESCERVCILKNVSVDDKNHERIGKCRHCGYSSNTAIRPFCISSEAAGTVACYDLIREVPPFEDDEEGTKKKSKFAKALKKNDSHKQGSVICFSDKRQDAAFFAPAMRRTYNKITVRQLIYQTIDRYNKNHEGESILISLLIKQLYQLLTDDYKSTSRYLFPDESKPTTDEIHAWLLDELMAEDSRNSLAGLGVIDIIPEDFNNSLEDEEVREIVEEEFYGLLDGQIKSWLTLNDYLIISKFCLETLRERGCVYFPKEISVSRTNFVSKTNYVVIDDVGALEEDVRFCGSANTTKENKRINFVRRYAEDTHSISLSRDEAVTILQNVFSFLVALLGELGYLRGEDCENRFAIDEGLWTWRIHAVNQPMYRCSHCGCETSLFTNGVCITTNCNGSMKKIAPTDTLESDAYYKEIYRKEAYPINIQEHTAQLSTTTAREVQSAFIKGNVNVLSCTTTFELGVDVGDLRAIFMRNVPPSTANYTQRAGRVGRRAGKPGFALTFCKLRPHDISLFKDPTKMIAGSSPVPSCYMNNESIAQRHIFSAALSQFFRYYLAKTGHDCSKIYGQFLHLDEDYPEVFNELREFLDSHPKALERQLRIIFSQNEEMKKELGVDDWSWISRLVVPEDAEKTGRLNLVHLLKREDYKRIEDSLQLNKENSKAMYSLYKTKDALDNQRTISVLAENGILPKYGFPTDVVELDIAGFGENSPLNLSRGLRQAIFEYAPGSEVVAQNKVWKSTGIRRPRGQQLVIRKYDVCPHCGTFYAPIEDLSKGEETCPVCGSSIKLNRRMLVPSYGFVGKKSSKKVGLQRPKQKGYARTYFSQSWQDGAKEETFVFSGGSVCTKHASNGHLTTINENGNAGFHICATCGAAGDESDKIKHLGWCKNKQTYRVNALGTTFVSDILELQIITNYKEYQEEEWESAAWALYTAAAELLEIPSSEIGVTYYLNNMNSYSIMLYDNVPGGAGHMEQIATMIEPLIKKAYEIVANCTCGEETCCYGCIANYYNQYKQQSLSRGAAKRILGSLIGEN